MTFCPRNTCIYTYTSVGAKVLAGNLPVRNGTCPIFFPMVAALLFLHPATSHGLGLHESGRHMVLIHVHPKTLWVCLLGKDRTVCKYDAYVPATLGECPYESAGHRNYDSPRCSCKHMSMEGIEKTGREVSLAFGGGIFIRHVFCFGVG